MPQKRSISVGEMYWTICVEWAGNRHIFVLLDLKFSPPATLVQRYISTKLEVSTDFLFRECRRHGTDL